MAEHNETPNAANAGATQDEGQPSFNLQRTYVKDLSVEMPNAPQIFLEQEAPKVGVDLNISAERIADTIFEATVTATVTTRINDKVRYIVEGTQAGIFELANIPQEQIDPLLGIVCPTMLYPYLRATIADAINRTSLPALHLTEVNFQQMYEQRLAEQGEGNADAQQPTMQ